ncbi:hypothetical protein [Aliiroseovarius sp. PrR006]|uniref:hypothetical protein n=1 Tax=Aliiroseovarius sp. PrR006 TaxID=2706883 RepID=UPI0013CF6833|nr:hypothetical protein [Aliiroseovarius sp. PrR006]NDW53788.1 hypothetical protein [Aliiroseovarius sp. PrR006]
MLVKRYRGQRAGGFGAWIAALLIFLLPAEAPASDHVSLGDTQPGEILLIELDQLLPLTRLKVEIDGEQVWTTLDLSGTTLRLKVPTDLTGNTHEIVLYEETPRGDVFIGRWEFTLVAAGTTEAYVALQAESGVVGNRDEHKVYTGFGGRLDFDIRNGLLRGGLSFSRAALSDPVTGEYYAIDDHYLETRHTVLGGNLFLRLGSHYYNMNGNLIDQASRRGVSLRFVDEANRDEVAAFVLQPSLSTSTENLIGVDDWNDRVYGATTQIAPFLNSGLRLGFTAYDGRAGDLPNGSVGSVRGKGVSLSAPVFGDRMDILLSADETAWFDGGTWRSGQALEAELTVRLTPPEIPDALSLGLGYSQIDQDFHSPLNPNLIVGERAKRVEVDYAGHEWSWALGAEQARTNEGGSPDQAVDRLTRLSFETTYAPDVFTGGFLNGARFYFSSELFVQERLETPLGALPEQDHQLASFNVGMNKFTERGSYAVLYSYEDLDYLSSPDGDEIAHGLEFLASVAPNDRLDATVQLNLRHHTSTLGKFWEARAAASLNYTLVPGLWDYAFEAGIVEYSDGADENARYLRQELGLTLIEDHSLVFSAEYMRGDWSRRMLDGDGWLFGIALRSDLRHIVYR